MKAVDAAIFGTINADVGGTATGTLGELGATGCYRMLAPQTATTPFVVFGQQSGVDSWTFADRERKSLTYMVKAIGDGHSGSVVSAMNDRFDTLLNDAGGLSVSGWNLKRIRRESDIEYIEVDDGITYHHIGGLFRVDVEPQ